MINKLNKIGPQFIFIHLQSSIYSIFFMTNLYFSQICDQYAKWLLNYFTYSIKSISAPPTPSGAWGMCPPCPPSYATD